MRALRRWMQRWKDWRRHPEILWVKEEDGLRASLEVRNWLYLLLLAGVWLWYLAAPGVTIAFFTAGCSALVGCAFWWAWRLAHGLRGRRILQSAAMQVGDELEEQVRLEDHSFLPALWVELADESDFPGHTIAGVRGVSGKTVTAWRVTSACTRRGVFRLGPWELLTSDPFGVFRARVRMLPSQEMLVYPPLAALPAGFFPHQNAIGDHQPLRQAFQAATEDGMSVRGYLPGDPLRQVHWPTTARMGVPYVKVFQPEAASRVWIVPDLDPRVQQGQGADSTEETIVLLAASLAAELLHARLAVGLFAGGDPPMLVMPQRGSLQVWPILERLAPLHPAAGVCLEQTLGQVAPLYGPRDLLVLVSASLDPAWLADLRRLLARRGGAARAYLLDPASYGDGPSAEQFAPALAEVGVEARVIRRGEIQALTAAYGALSRWEFTVSATGRALARQSPRPAGTRNTPPGVSR